MKIERRETIRLPALLVLLFILAPECPASEGAEVIAASSARAAAWLEGVRVPPFGSGVAGFRLAVVEVETWHRLWLIEADPVKRSRWRSEVMIRLEQVLDPSLLLELLGQPDGKSALTEMAVLAARCRTHGLDPSPIGAALTVRKDGLEREIERAPPSIQALYARYLPEAGVRPPIPMEKARSEAMLARRPSEIGLSLADIYYLTHEIYALTDYALEPLHGLSDEEAAYLLRVLPFYALFYGALDRLDVAAELMTCMHAAGMRDTYAYREGIRVIVEAQNPDGSFGTPDPRKLGRPVTKSDYLHATMNCVTALALEERDRRSEGE